MKTRLILALATAACLVAGASSAALLGVNQGYPTIGYASGSSFALTYTASNQLFTVTAPPTTVRFSGTEAPRPITGTKNLQVKCLVDDSGALAGGVSGDDLVISGTVTRTVAGVTVTYTGVLLKGEVIGFGYLEAGTTDNYEIRFAPTGGELASMFCGQVSMRVVSEASTFAGSFAVNFNGRAKDNLGSEDLTPPAIVCPTDMTVECHSGSNGLAGAYVSYALPVVTDNCDPNPILICTPPSGAFFPLPADAGVTNYIVTCVAQDAAGNTNICTFNITVQDTLPPEFADLSNPVVNCTLCVPLIITNDPGKCYANLVFPIPTATDNCCPLTIAASVSAVDENGVAIPLMDLGNGYLQGEFPISVLGTNVVTVTADDGRGNSAQNQCAVVVVDTEAPTLDCRDQAATFKPILTNVLNCIEADFHEDSIEKGSYIWFSSVIKNTSRYNGSFTVHLFDQTIEIALDDTNIVLQVPEAYVTFTNGVPMTTTVFTNGTWVTISKPPVHGNTFASGLGYEVPFDFNSAGPSWWSWANRCSTPRRHVKSVTWCARFEVSKPNVVIQWQWAAAVHGTFTTDYNDLCVKPVDDDDCSAWRNDDPAGSCQKYKKYVKRGARGRGWWHHDPHDCTGVLSCSRRVNLGKGPVCYGAVEFNPPTAVDNCLSSHVNLNYSLESGSVLGPGVYPVTVTADDSRGNTNQCTFNLTVLSPLQVLFETPCNDNLNDNTCQPDEGFTDMNCPDDPFTTQHVTRFYVGDKIPFEVRLRDCNGNDVTAEMGQYVTVHIDVTEREGTYSNSVLINDLAESYCWVGSTGGLMALVCDEFRYYLNTALFETGTICNERFFRACVWVEYNSSPGVPVGMEDVVLESR